MQTGFGRRYVEDTRDQNYPMRLRLDPLREQFFPKGVPHGSRHYTPTPPIIVQGNSGTCVTHAGTSYLNAPPIMQRAPMSPFELYRRVILRDEWDDNDHEATGPDSGLQSGTSIRALMEELKALGFIRSYLWAETVEDARAWLLSSSGGLIGGFAWKSGMMETDTEGFVSFTGRNEGGHAVYLGGWNDRVRRGGRFVRAVRAQQSWPLPWGQGGRFWISEDDLHKMLTGWSGELCAPTEIRVTKR